MRWFKVMWLRVPVWVAIVVAIATCFVINIVSDPKLPLVDSWTDAPGHRVIARVLLALIALGIVFIALTIIWGSLLNGLPSQLKAPLGIEMSWTPTEAKEVKAMMEAQEKELRDQAKVLTEHAELIKDTVGRVDALSETKARR